MPSLSVSRTMLRQSTLRPARQIRFESTTSKASSAAKDTAASFQSKASEGLSKVSAAAGPAISNAAKGLSKRLGQMGGRVGAATGFVERQIPQVIYYARVGKELGTLVFHGQKMAPPPTTTFQSYFQRVIRSVRNPSVLFQSAQETATKTNPVGVMQQVRDLSRGQIVAGGVVVAEVLGFFTLGEVIGKRKLVGYRGETAAHH